jgi:hypothetical protein
VTHQPALDGDWGALVKDLLLDRPCGEPLRTRGVRIEAGVDKPEGYDAYAEELVLLTIRGGTPGSSTGVYHNRNLYVRCYSQDEAGAVTLGGAVERALDGASYRKIRMITPGAGVQEAREEGTGFAFSFLTFKLQTTK